MRKKIPIVFTLFLLMFASCKNEQSIKKDPVDYVNPYMGNISHLLEPTYPTIQLPNSMLRVFPQRKDYTSDLIHGLPIIVPTHRSSTAFNISPTKSSSSKISSVVSYTYDNEKTTPFRYSVYLGQDNIDVDFAPSHQSAVYSFDFEKEGDNLLILNTRNGKIEYKDGSVSGVQQVFNSPTKIYLYLETEQKPEQAGVISGNSVDYNVSSIEGKDQAVVLKFKEKQVNVRYGVSYISVEQAKNNLNREIATYSVDEIAQIGKNKWNESLSKMMVEGDNENDKTIFYTSLYRTYERMINISEDGKYYSPFDQEVHNDEGTPFYIDDWVWDTYRATHPLRVLIEPKMESDMINSYVRMAQQTPNGWMPTFPEVTGDSHCMNGNHIVGVIADAYAKGLRGYELKKAYEACRKSAMERSRLPWVKIPNTELDVVYNEKGYFPALYPGEKETVEGVHAFEKREVIAITLAACYDDWCMSLIAKELGEEADYNFFLNRSYFYRNVYNSATGFFHPKDKKGKFIEPFDYTYSGGMGAREYYDENNGWVYRWDLVHNIADLVQLMGSPESFVANLDETFSKPVDKSKYAFYCQLPDHTGWVGQYAMGNEPCLHIPYLYNYAGQPWKTQKRVREVVKYWFRNDLMGVPGDEDGGGLSAFVVFTALGFYPVTPGSPTYNIGSPLFKNAKVKLGNGKIFEIDAQNCSDTHKYIQSARLNGKTWDKPWFSHDDIKDGAKLVLVMGDKPNKSWGAALENVPPSAKALIN